VATSTTSNLPVGRDLESFVEGVRRTHEGSRADRGEPFFVGIREMELEEPHDGGSKPRNEAELTNPFRLPKLTSVVKDRA